jgi:uncharacterized RDD family membrane protein YckC
MDDDTTINRFAPPGAHVQDVAESAGPELATRLQRFAGGLIDGLFAFALMMAIMLQGYGMEYFTMVAASRMSVLGGTLVFAALFYAIEGWFLYHRSQSLGKMAMGLRIVRADGSPASFGRSFGLRLFLFGVCGRIPYVGPCIGIVDALFIFGGARRCLHDYVADTIVVTAASTPMATGTPARS